MILFAKSGSFAVCALMFDDLSVLRGLLRSEFCYFRALASPSQILVQAF